MVGGRILNSSAQELGACAQHSHTRTHERTHKCEHSLTHEHSHICTRYSANSHTSTTTSISAHSHASANAHEKHTPSHSKKHLICTSFNEYSLCNRTHQWFCANWYSFWKAIETLLFPRGCAGCNKPDEILCKNCLNLMNHVYSKDLPGSEYKKLYACSLYEGPIRTAILSWKDHNDIECDTPFSKVISSLTYTVIANHKQKENTKYTTISENISHCIDRKSNKTLQNNDSEIIIIPMPSSKKSLHNRGRKHIMPLAKAIESTLNCHKIKSRVCCAIRMNKSVSNKSVQTSGIKGRLARSANAFIVTKNLVENRKVIIVDDIVTTGSTMSNCTNALKKSGATVIAGFALAITTSKIH